LNGVEVGKGADKRPEIAGKVPERLRVVILAMGESIVETLGVDA
jgi:hypothetical protein